jgi:hypothetical protein
MSSCDHPHVGMLLMLTALVLALSRAPDRPVETLVARWAPPPSDFVEVKGQVVHLRDEGPRDDAAPIVLLHGTSGQPAHLGGLGAGAQGAAPRDHASTCRASA